MPGLPELATLDPSPWNGRDVDWIAVWYAVAAERGRNHVFTLTRIDTSTGERVHHDVSHTRMDGVGALGAILRARGVALPRLPRGRNRPAARASLVTRVAGLRELTRPKRVPWIGGSSRVPGPHEHALVTLSRGDTARLAAPRARHGPSQNALVMSAAHATLAPRLMRYDAPTDWLFAVNMRGAFDHPIDTANHSTGIPITCSLASTPAEVHAQIRHKLDEELHYLMWRCTHVGRVVGVAGVRWLSQRFDRTSQWMGTLTNMGEWPPEGSDPIPDPHEAWGIVPPGTPGYPIGVGLLTWHGRLTIALKIHPSVLDDPPAIPGLLDEVVARALALADAS